MWLYFKIWNIKVIHWIIYNTCYVFRFCCASGFCQPDNYMYTILLFTKHGKVCLNPVSCSHLFFNSFNQLFFFFLQVQIIWIFYIGSQIYCIFFWCSFIIPRTFHLQDKRSLGDFTLSPPCEVPLASCEFKFRRMWIILLWVSIKYFFCTAKS